MGGISEAAPFEIHILNVYIRSGAEWRRSHDVFPHQYHLAGRNDSTHRPRLPKGQSKPPDRQSGEALRDRRAPREPEETPEGRSVAPSGTRSSFGRRVVFPGRRGMAHKRRVNYLRRGEVYLVNFDPVIGAEIRKTRPALILQNDIANRHSPLTIVAATPCEFE